METAFKAKLSLTPTKSGLATRVVVKAPRRAKKARNPKVPSVSLLERRMRLAAFRELRRDAASALEDYLADDWVSEFYRQLPSKLRSRKDRTGTTFAK